MMASLSHDNVGCYYGDMTTFTGRFVLNRSVDDTVDAAFLDRLYRHFDAGVETQYGRSVVTVSFEAESGVAGARSVVSGINGLERDLEIVEVDEDFVTISNIADRVGRTRQGVRHYVEGIRGPGGFPKHRCVVGDGQRVWDWSVVNEWFREHFGSGDPERHLSRDEVVRVQNWLLTLHERVGMI
jgi:hypothetical protein